MSITLNAKYCKTVPYELVMETDDDSSDVD